MHLATNRTPARQCKTYNLVKFTYQRPVPKISCYLHDNWYPLSDVRSSGKPLQLTLWTSRSAWRIWKTQAEQLLKPKFLIFGYGNMSTITPEGEPIVSLIVPTSTNVAGPSRDPLFDGQVTNITSGDKLWEPQNSPLQNAIGMPRVEPRHLRFEEPEFPKNQEHWRPLGRENPRGSVRYDHPRTPSKSMVRVISPISMAIKITPPLEKFPNLGSSRFMVILNQITMSCTIKKLWPYRSMMLGCAKHSHPPWRGASYEMVLGVAARTINYFESLADIFTNTYSMYRDICKSHEVIFKMIPQSKDESLRTYL